MEPKNLSINDFTYDLPDEKIAKYPLQKRDDSKLLIYDDGIITESNYHQIAKQIPKSRTEQFELLFANSKRQVSLLRLIQVEAGLIIVNNCISGN